MHDQRTQREKELASCKSARECDAVSAKWDAISKKQQADAQGCIDSSNCKVVLNTLVWPSIESALNSAKAECAPPRACSAQAQDDLNQLQHLWDQKDAIKNFYEIEKFAAEFVGVGKATTVAIGAISKAVEIARGLRAADEAAAVAKAGELPTWTANGGAYSSTLPGGTPITTVRAGPGYSAGDVLPTTGELAGEAKFLGAGFTRYLNNSSNPEIQSALIDQVARLRSSLPAELQGKGNMAFAQIDVPGIPNNMKAFSRLDSGEFGYAAVPKGPTVFEPLSVDKYGRVDTAGSFLRNVDGEYKILENIAQKLGENPLATGRIDLFTELKACTSCASTIIQFRTKYPGIQLNVFTGK